MIQPKTLWDCKHKESLIYFDQVKGLATSWEICTVCGTEFNRQTLEKAVPYYDEHLGWRTWS